MQKETEEQNDGTQCLTSDAPYKLSPATSLLGAMLLDQPLAAPAQLESRAVHQQVHRRGLAPSLGAAARPWPGYLQRRGPAAEGGVVRHTQAEAEQADDGANQAFGLPERQTEHGAHGQSRQDGELRIPGLPAPGRAGFGRPRFDRLLGEPHRQTPTL